MAELINSLTPMLVSICLLCRYQCNCLMNDCDTLLFYGFDLTDFSLLQLFSSFQLFTLLMLIYIIIYLLYVQKQTSFDLTNYIPKLGQPQYCQHQITFIVIDSLWISVFVDLQISQIQVLFILGMVQLNFVIIKIKAHNKYNKMKQSSNTQININGKQALAIQQILGQIRQRNKKGIIDDSAYLRQQFWLKIQSVFRKISEYGQEFQQSIQTALNSQDLFNFDVQKLIKWSTDKIVVRQALLSSLLKTGQFYNASKMKIIMQNILSQLNSCMDQIIEKQLPGLFILNFEQIQQNIKSISGKKQKYGEQKDQCKNKNSFQSRHKSMSVQKDNRTKNYFSQLKTNANQLKQRQFQQLYHKIRKSKQRQRLLANQDSLEHNHQLTYNKNFFTPSRSDFALVSENPYGLSSYYSGSKWGKNQAVKRFQRTQQLDYKQTGQFANFTQPSKFDYSVNSNSKTHNSNKSHKYNYKKAQASRDRSRFCQLNPVIDYSKVNNNTISPISSRVVLNEGEWSSYFFKQPGEVLFKQQSRISQSINHSKHQPNKRITTPSYHLNYTQSSIFAEWCQEVAISSDVHSINVPTSIDYSALPQHQGQHAQQKSLKSGKKLNQSLLCLTFCNGFKLLAIGSKNTLIYIYEMPGENQQKQPQHSTNRLVTKLNGHTASVCCLHQHNDILFSGGDLGCNSILLWNTSNWTLRSKLTLNSASISCILGIPSTDYIVSSSFDRTLSLYNYSTCQITDCYQTNTSIYISLLYFEQLGKLVAATPSTTIGIFDIDTTSQTGFQLVAQRSITCQATVTSIQKSVSPQSNLITAALQNGNIQIYKLPDCSIVNKVPVNKGDILAMLTFSRLNKNLYPIIVCMCLNSKSFYLVNTQTFHLSQCNVKGNVDIALTKGIGPVLIANDQNWIAWVSQSPFTSKVHFSKFHIY